MFDKCIFININPESHNFEWICKFFKLKKYISNFWLSPQYFSIVFHPGFTKVIGPSYNDDWILMSQVPKLHDFILEIWQKVMKVGVIKRKCYCSIQFRRNAFWIPAAPILSLFSRHLPTTFHLDSGNSRVT